MSQEQLFIFWNLLPILLELTAFAALVFMYFTPAPEPQYEKARESAIENCKIALIAIPLLFGLSVMFGYKTWNEGSQAIMANAAKSNVSDVRTKVEIPAGTVVTSEQLQLNSDESALRSSFIGKRTKRTIAQNEALKIDDVESADSAPAPVTPSTPDLSTTPSAPSNPGTSAVPTTPATPDATARVVPTTTSTAPATPVVPTTPTSPIPENPAN
ncbi:MAG: hypothetical protein K2X93_16565 [Candidatus Obscuribacterales bacterium]|nr:hypothetical protein [Candidatus Obscuribacterales bacterium]